MADENQNHQGGAWLDGVSEDLRGEETLKKFTSVDGLAKSYVELEKRLGRSVVIPGEGATTEEVQAFRARMGVPDAPEGYGFKIPQIEGVEINEARITEAAQVMHDLGIAKDTASKLLDVVFGKWVPADAEAMQRMVEQQRTEAEAQLKKEWGDGYTGKVEQANRVLSLAPADLQGHIKQISGNDPHFIKFLSMLGEKITEGRFVQDHVDTSPESLEKRIQDLKADPDYWNTASPRHKGLRDEVKKLYGMKYKE